MKFVHITNFHAISRIRKSGLRAGNGRCGKGLYAVPLVHTPHSTTAYSDGHLLGDERQILSDLRSNLKMWSWLPRNRNRQARTAAIVFRIPPQCWPIRLFIELAPVGGPRFVGRCIRHTEIGLELRRQNVDDVLADFAKGYWPRLEYSVAGPQAVKAVMTEALIYMKGPSAEWEDTYEFVIPSRVPPRCIERIVPLYKTSKKFNAGRARRSTRSELIDIHGDS